jgi:hypothetical protein
MPSNRPPLYPNPGPMPTPRARPAAQRKKDKAEREQARWDAKYARAVTPAQRAAVDFDRVRAAIKDLERVDPNRADAHWHELSAILRRLCDATRRDVAPKRR